LGQETHTAKIESKLRRGSRSEKILKLLVHILSIKGFQIFRHSNGLLDIFIIEIYSFYLASMSLHVTISEIRAFLSFKVEPLEVLLFQTERTL
jgi:hypothetical protein